MTQMIKYIDHPEYFTETIPLNIKIKDKREKKTKQK